MKNHILSVALLFLCVNVFASPPVGTITSFSPSTASTGTTVIITGTGLSLTTSVKFGNVQAASFTIISGTQVNAVVPAGSSGSIEMIISGITVSKAGFLYLRTSGIITDFNGYWKTSDLNVNPVNPDNSHNMLAFTVDGITYSTGVKQYILDNNSIVYTPGNFKALPVAGISGSNTGIGVYIALAKNKDGSSGVANTAAVSDYSISKSLTDGENGLDLGTGITNLPASADLTFQIFSIDPAKISDAEPDLILTQIASPSAGNDIFSLVDASGTIVGNTKTQDMFDLPQLGTYLLDLFNITPNVAYDKGKVYSASSTGSREIRIAAFKLSDFGITAGNAAQVRALKIAPSSTSDYAFIAYNVNSINLPPNVTRSNAGTNENICGGGTSMLEVIASPSAGGVLSYVWEELAPAASDWTILTESAKYIAVNSNRLTVVNPDNNAKYRVRVTETGNTNTALSPEFSITVIAPSPPTSVTIAGGSSICLNSPSQLTSSVAGGTTRFYQWQQNISGTFQNIDGANQDSYAPVINQTGSFVYRLLVSGANGCTAVTSNSATVTISGIASTTPTAVCTGSPVILNAAATAGTIDWYTVDNAGSSVATGSSYSPVGLASTKTYYVVSSGCASALRVPVRATIYPLTTGGTITGGTSVTPDVNSTTLTVTANNGSVVKWQSSTDAFGAVINDIANTTPQLTVINLNQNSQFRALLQSGSCPTAFSTAASITMFITLAINDKSIKVSGENNGVIVQWSAMHAAGATHYEVERSVDGHLYVSLYSMKPSDNLQSVVIYRWFDANPVSGIGFYRIKEVSRDGSISYSDVAKFISGKGKSSITVYPNPVAGFNLQLKFNDVKAGVYNISLLNASGQLMVQKKHQHDGGDQIQTLIVPRHLARGTYKVQVNGEGVVKSFTVLVM